MKNKKVKDVTDKREVIVRYCYKLIVLKYLLSRNHANTIGKHETYC